MRGTSTRRRISSVAMQGLVYTAALIATLPLLAILTYLIIKGSGSIGLGFFTKMPRGVGEPGGGMANAITGTLILLGVACAVGLPIGLGSGLYLAEKSAGPMPATVRFLADVLNGLPSIVMGSALAGGLALAAMMIPMVTRTTEEMVRLVPVTLREAALALGYSHWRTSLSIVLRTALGGIVTGALVAVARMAGETAPLLFTAFGNNFWSTSLAQPIAALPLEIFNYAISPYDEWHRLAWAGALVLVALVLVISLAARFATRGRYHAGD
jgi:phosphate transport system permease protein